MQLREILDFFTQFMVLMTCIKILGLGKLFMCAAVSAYMGAIVLMIVVEEKE